jgi:hypothetical protein
MIVHKQNKWLVMDSSGKKILGTHYSKKDAADQLAAIEISKKRKKQIEETPNLLNNSMNNLTEYYKKLCEDLMGQRMVLEAKIKEEKHKKKHKKHGKDDKSDKADKDYDGDGEVESKSKEYLDSKSNAIKKAIAKREGKDLKESRYNPETGQFYEIEISPADRDVFNNLLNPNRKKSSIFKRENLGAAFKRLSKTDDIMDMRRKAAEMGGIPDDMVNEPVPSSSSSRTPSVSDYLKGKRREEYDDFDYTPYYATKKSIKDVAQDLLNSFGNTRLKKEENKLPTVPRRERNPDLILKDKSTSIFDNLKNNLKNESDEDYKVIPKDYTLYSGIKKGLMGESLDYVVNPDKSIVNNTIKKLNKEKN